LTWRKRAIEARGAYLGDAAVDVVLLDLQMPVMDGRSFYRAFRERGHSAPVLILSAYDAAAARDELAAEAFLDKPFDPSQVLASVSRLVGGWAIR
jgi:CheY-like chemotaxis protein